jgi:hypothetical protein
LKGQNYRNPEGILCENVPRKHEIPSGFFTKHLSAVLIYFPTSKSRQTLLRNTGMTKALVKLKTNSTKYLEMTARHIHLYPVIWRRLRSASGTKGN